MSNPRTCPHCQVTIPLQTGYYYDKKMNFICSKCKKIAMPSNDTDDSYTLFNSYGQKTPYNYSYPNNQHALNPEHIRQQQQQNHTSTKFGGHMMDI